MFLRIIMIICSGTLLVSQSIDETLDQIEFLKKEIEDNTKLVEDKIADLKKTNPLFSDQDIFESDAEYLGRMSKAMPQLDQIRKQYLGDLWTKMSILRGRMFETKDIHITLDKNSYDANTEQWPIKVMHLRHQQEVFDITINIPRQQASELYKNWDKVQKTGILTIDLGDRIGLAKIKFNDPISGFEFMHEFRPMRTLDPDGNERDIAFSPDGKYFAIASGNKAYIYNLLKSEKGQLKPLKASENILALAFSPDGKYLAVGTAEPYYREYPQIIIYDIKNEKTFKESTHSGQDISDIAFSPDGMFLAVGYENQTRLYNLETFKSIAAFDPPGRSVTFSPDGKYLAISNSNWNYLSVYNLETQTPIWEVTGHSNFKSIAFSPDGKYFAFGNQLYNFDKQKLIRNYNIDSSMLSAFSPNGKYLAISSNSNDIDRKHKLISIYETDSSRPVRDFAVYTKGYNIQDIAFSPDGKYIAVATYLNAQLFRTFFQIEEEVLAQKAISKPPSLSASIAFTESSENQFLDALEKGNFTITIKNDGKGPGKGILVKIMPERTDNLDYNNTYIEEIAPGKTVAVEIPIEAYIGIADADHTFRFNFEEINGFPPNPVELQFSTKSYLKPEMYVVDIGIEDGNLNGKIESGEMITLTIRIGNKGKGTAKSAYAKFYSDGDNVFITQSYPKTIKLGELEYNSFIDIPLEFFVNDKAKDKIPLYVDLTEETNLATVSKFRLPINKSERTYQIGKTIVKGIEQEYDVLKLGEDLSIDIEQNIPELGIENKHSVAIVIGNKNYVNADVPEVTFAHRDAAIMEQYLIKMLGYDEVIVETDATQGKFFALFGSEKKNGKLQDYIKSEKSDVFIYYSGHGAPDPESKDGYFVPVDCDPAMVDVNGYSLDLFYSKLNQLKAKSITVVIDACFSGSSDQGMLLKNISPVFIKTSDSVNLKEHINVFTSSSGEQVSSWYPDKKHSLYTYYFLKGLKGSANQDNDDKLSVNEIQNYVNEEVSFMARKLNSREQNPGLKSKNKDKIFIQY